ncbi:MAG: CBS domain-containing protein, partial [Aestuariivirgaceae bacterium]
PMSVAHILQTKGSDVISISPTAAIMEVAGVLAENKIGAVLVIEGEDHVAGIISERDVVRALAKKGKDVAGAKVGDFMTRELITCAPDATINQIMSLMTQGRVRHLPVLEDGKLCGMISIGDIVKRRIAEVEFEAEEMKRYISG